MNDPRAPRWLADFQGAFSRVLLTPLDPRTGTLRAREEDYPSQLLGAIQPGPGRPAAAGLAVYHRQYWFRLLSALQSELRLTAALLGAWTFNQLVAPLLADSPPGTHDLADVADGIATRLAQGRDATPLRLPGGSRLPGLALAQACAIDEAFRAALRAPGPPVTVRPIALDENALPRTVLVPSGVATVVEEDWPMLALHGRLGSTAPERPLALPARHPQRVHAAIHRTRDGIAVLALHPLQARLYREASARPLGSVLADLEAAASRGQRETLAANVRDWLATSVRLGFWAGVAPC